MRSERFQRLQDQLDAQGVDGLVLLGSSSVAYATGAAEPAANGDRAALFRAVSVVVKGDTAPHLYTHYVDGVPDDLPGDHLHGPLFPDLDDGIEQFARALSDHFGPGARIGIDHQTHPVLRALPGVDWVDAADVVSPAKLIKTPDEVACIRNAQLLNELAMVDALRILRPGVRQIDLSAAFLRRVFELGASANSIDPIWQVMAPTRELGPWTLHGDLAYPTVTTDRFLRDGDIIWVDSGHQLAGLRLRLRPDLDHRLRSGPECQAAGPVPPLAVRRRRRARHPQARRVSPANSAKPPSMPTTASALDRTFLSGPRCRHRQCRNAAHRNGSR